MFEFWREILLPGLFVLAMVLVAGGLVGGVLALEQWH